MTRKDQKTLSAVLFFVVAGINIFVVARYLPARHLSSLFLAITFMALGIAMLASRKNIPHDHDNNRR